MAINKIIVHDGVFHAHDIFACAAAIVFFDCTTNSIFRTRSLNEIDTLLKLSNETIAIDVGWQLKDKYP